MSEPWFYVVNGERRGPVAGPALAQARRAGELRPSSLVWREGMPEWRPAGEALADLFREDEWYYLVAGAPAGPVDEPGLRGLLSAGTIGRDTPSVEERAVIGTGPVPWGGSAPPPAGAARTPASP